VYFYYFVCTSVGLLPPGESPIAASNNNNNNNNKYIFFLNLTPNMETAVFYKTSAPVHHTTERYFSVNRINFSKGFDFKKTGKKMVKIKFGLE
jgi:hypothetical protein